MSIIVRNEPQANWPNFRTLLNTSTFIVGLVSQVQIPDKLWQINLPFRLCSFSYAIYKADFRKASFDAAATGALILPYGGFIASAIDGVAEYLNYKTYHPAPKETKPKKPQEVNKETAYRLFELKEGSQVELDSLRLKVDKMKENLISKKAKLPTGKLTESLDEVIEKLELNYQFLLKQRT